MVDVAADVTVAVDLMGLGVDGGDVMVVDAADAGLVDNDDGMSLMPVLMLKELDLIILLSCYWKVCFAN